MTVDIAVSLVVFGVIVYAIAVMREHNDIKKSEHIKIGDKL